MQASLEGITVCSHQVFGVCQRRWVPGRSWVVHMPCRRSFSAALQGKIA